MKIKAGIIGGTGYTGVELLRLLAQHPEVEIKVITSRSEAGKKVSDLFLNLAGLLDIEFSEPDIDILSACDVVFSAAPNGIAMQYARELVEAGVRLIDLAADFRFKDSTLWSKWYSMEHSCPDLLPDSVYGICEARRKDIKDAKIVGNPGCYPTAVQLALLPLLERDLLKPDTIIADCKSGVSGAGRGASVAGLQAESAENFKAYAVTGHRHRPEIEHNLQDITGSKVNLVFVPHLTPMIRGIHATIYADLINHKMDLQEIFLARYENEFFVDVLENGTEPETKWVKGSNKCKLAVQQIKGSSKVVILSVIDNLVKGASGQAVQNMNIMFGLPEVTGLTQVALMP